MTVHQFKQSGVQQQLARERQAKHNNHATVTEVNECIDDGTVLDFKEALALRKLKKMGYVWEILKRDALGEDPNHVPKASVFVQVLEAQQKA